MEKYSIDSNRNGAQSFRLVIKPGDGSSLSAKDFLTIVGLCILGGIMMIVITAVTVL